MHDTTQSPRIIGLVGRAGAGKDTVAGYLEARHSWERVGFADPILHMVCALMQDADADFAYAVEPSMKEQPMPTIGISYRRIAQTLGTDWGRRLDPDLWVRLAEYRARRCIEVGLSVAISDVRFPNEADMVRRMGGRIVRVVREQGAAQLAAEAAQHDSEAWWGLIQADHELLNLGSVATLHDQIERMLDDMQAGRL